MVYRHSVPWQVVPEEGLPLIVSKAQPGYIAQCFDDDQNARANAAYIVKAANALPEYEQFIRKLEKIAKGHPDAVTADWLISRIDVLKEVLTWPS
jgi:hypothetical protein